MSPLKKIILALDLDDADYASELVDKFSCHVDIFKVGLELFTTAGPHLVKKIHDKGRRVFLDLKFHDIPTTAARAGIAAARMGVFMFNVHASGGLDMMKRCTDDVVNVCLRENLDRPRILGVTVLTSLSPSVIRDELGIQHSLRTHVRHLAGLSLKAGLDGVVASAQEAEMIRAHCGPGFLIVTPGIRTSWSPADDQMRTMTPRQAIRAGADYLVMGRAVLREKDPLKCLEMIDSEIESA